MLVVSNTSPILNLAVIGLLDLLRIQFGDVLVPEAVIKELRLDEDMQGNDLIREALASGWLVVCPVADRQKVQLLARELDFGESEAIALALERDASLILLDETEGRAAARGLGLTVTGILGVVKKAHISGAIDSLEKVIVDLRDRAGFHLSDGIVQSFLS